MERWRLWTLLVAVVAVPGVIIGFRVLGRPGGNAAAFGVEVVAFALSAALLWMARVKQGLSWAELGLARPPVWPTLRFALLGLLGVAAGLAACLGAFQALGLSYGEGDGVERPLWLLTVMIVRAGIVEELTFRGIAIGHTASLTGSRALGFLLPTLLFGALHYSQGLTGIVIATVSGGILGALYLWSRNLWANFAIHFSVDFVPNILLPLLGVIE